MSINSADAESLLRAGATALRNGDALHAATLIRRLTDAGIVNAQILLLLATAYRLSDDRDAEETALDRLLALEPRNLHALIMKADCRVAAGDNRGASSFYLAAVRSAPERNALPAELRAEVERAEQRAAALDQQYRTHLDDWLTSQGFGADVRSARFQQSLDILRGERKIYLQQPSAYYFPALPQIQFYQNEVFDWAEKVEAAAEAIHAELSALLNEGTAFSPYLVSDPARPRADFHGLHDNPDWSTLYLWERGGPTPYADRCPRTMEAIGYAPLAHITTRSPSILFSLLKAGARIPPHTGMINTRLICHLPLLVPAKCGIRVGNETRIWEPGKLLVFDDTIEHEAWNESDEDRIVLIFDVWRPELDESERQAVTAMFTAIDAYEGTPL